MKYFSMFSGCGTGELGIEKAFDRIASKRNVAELRFNRNSNGGNYSSGELQKSAISGYNACIGISEIDKYAAAVHAYNFPGVKNYGDATKLIPTDLPDFGFLIGGFPCQAFSIAGKRQGFNESRGTLFFEIARVLSHKRPRHFLLENVKGLLSHDDGKTFSRIIGILSDIGYRVEWTVLNSKDYGVPQNRERVFIIGHLREECGREVLSFESNGKETLKPLVGKDISVCLDASYYKGAGKLSLEKQQRQMVMNGRGLHKSDLIQIGQIGEKNDQASRIDSASGVSPTIPTPGGGNHMPKIIDYRREDTRKYTDNAPTLSARDYKGGIALEEPQTANRIRRLTPTECERLQGMPDGHTAFGDFDGEIKEISDTQRYKMAGNAFTVNVIEAIITQLIETGCIK